MKLKQLLENNNSQFLQTREEIEAWLQKMKIKNYTIRDDLMVDVDGNVDLSFKKLSFIPVKFWEVSGDFKCGDNQLTSLKGAPREVGGHFMCFHNQLESLKGAPREVGGHVNCSWNELQSLEGAPREVGGGFDCSYNQIKSLDGAPLDVCRDFWCKKNPHLESLEGIGNVGGQIYSDLS